MSSLIFTCYTTFSLANTFGFQSQNSVTLNNDCTQPNIEEFKKYLPDHQIEGEYDLGASHIINWLSDYSTKSRSKLKKKIRSFGYHVEIIEGKRIDGLVYSGRVLIVYDDENIFIIPRGTKSIQNWISNILAFPTLSSDIESEAMIHSGFKKTLDSLWFPFYKKFKGVIENRSDAKIWVGGHSLGGSMAVMVASRLHLKGHPIEALYIAAAPRLGDLVYSKQLNERFSGRFFHLQVEGDIVPHLPPNGEASPGVAQALKGFLKGLPIPINWNKIGNSLGKIDYRQIGVQLYASPEKTNGRIQFSNLEETHARDSVFWNHAKGILNNGDKKKGLEQIQNNHDVTKSYTCLIHKELIARY